MMFFWTQGYAIPAFFDVFPHTRNSFKKVMTSLEHILPLRFMLAVVLNVSDDGFFSVGI